MEVPASRMYGEYLTLLVLNTMSLGCGLPIKLQSFFLNDYVSANSLVAIRFKHLATRTLDQSLIQVCVGISGSI